ncbi:MAG: HYR domain-containing protein [Bacteroidales bacterium]|nr:HYR domain-containing protein [Bacteroidales bacterium]
MRSYTLKLVLLLSVLYAGTLSLYGQTTYTSATSGNWSDGSTWIGGLAPGSNDNAIIAAGTTVTIFAADAIINKLTIETGAVVNAGNRSLTVNGKMIVDGTYTSSNSDAKDLFFNGDTLGGTGLIKTDYADKDLIISANAVILSSSDLRVSGKISMGSDVTITNRGKIEVAGLISGASATTSIWTNSNNSYLATGDIPMATGILNASSAGNTVEYNKLGDQALKLPSASIYHKLVFRGSGNKSLPGNIVVNGDIEIYNSAILRSNDFNIDIKGDWTNHSDFVPGTGRVSFTGTVDQLIDNPMIERFYNLRLFKSSGELVLENDIIVENVLSMLTGVINTSGNKLTLGTGTATGDLGALTYFGGYIRGTFERWINNTGTHEFPVGDVNAQRMLVNINGLNTGGTLLAEFRGDKPGNAGLPLDDAGTSVYNTFSEGYWTLDMARGFVLGGTNNYSLQLYGTGFTSFPINDSTRVLTRTDASADWMADGVHLSGSGDIARRNNITSLPGHFAFGDTTNCTKPLTSAITGSADVCAGETTVAYSVTDNSPNTYTWTIEGGVQVSGSNTSSISIDWHATPTDHASVTVVESNTCTNGAKVVLPVTVHSVPPESITGKTKVASNSAGLEYSVPARTGYTYTWIITGGVQASGGNTSSITVDWGAAGMGNVEVLAELPGCPQAPAVSINVKIYDIIESIQSGSWDDPATWDCGCVPLGTDNVRVKNSHTVTLHNANDIEVNNFIIEAGGILDYNSRPFVVHGDFIVNGTYQGNTDRDLSIDGLDTRIEGAGTIAGGFIIPQGNKTVSSSSSLTVSAGDISLGSSVFMINHGEITLDGSIFGTDISSTWVNGENSILELTGALLSTGTLRALATGNLLEYSGGDQTIKTPYNSTYYDLTVSGSGTKTLSNSISIQRDLLINGTSNLDASLNNYNITIAGDWTNNGAAFQARASVVSFNGLTDQTISGAETFYKLVHSNTGGDLVLSDNITVGNNLNMSGRNILTGTNTLTIGTGPTSVGSLTYASGTVTGKMERWINSFGNNHFPVGTASSYNPAWLYVNLLNSPGSLIVEFFPNDPGSAGLPLVDGTTSITYHFTDGYWNFTAANGFDVANFNLELEANNFTSYPLNINTRILKRTNNLNWTFDGDHVLAVVPKIYRDLLVNGISSLGTQFGIAYACGPFTIDALITEPTCFGDSDGAIDITPLDGASPYTYSWSPGGETTEDISGLSAGNYTVEVTDALGCMTPETFNVSQPNEITIDYLVTDVECAGDTDGEIAISVSGGTAPYTYAWTTSDGSGLDPGGENQTGLTEGTYTVQVSDINGCTKSEDIVVNVVDIIPPVIICPAGLNAQCDISEQPAYLTYADFTAAGGTATDNCDIDESSFAMLSETSDGLSCPETLTRIYQISDVNGNSETCTHVISVDDTTPPTASNPAPLTVQCPADVPLPDISLVTDAADNCTASPAVVFIGDASDGNTCPEIITRTYRVSDDCGNTRDVYHTITIDDTTPPTASDPAPVSVECLSDVPAPDVNVVTDEADNCTADPLVTYIDDVSSGGACPLTITRTYRVSDDCGNSIDVEQLITVNDVTPPTASKPGPLSVECLSDVPAPDPTVVTDEADNCTAAPVVAFVNDVSDGNTCPETITRTYSVTDECGNSITVEQVISVHDLTPPTASNPGPVNVECPADVPVPDISVVSDAADNCGAPLIAFVSDVSDGNTCPETITRTYSLTDDCGNSITVEQVISIHDLTPPTASNPATISVQCPADVPAPDISLVNDAADNCGTPVITFVNDVSDGNICPETITRTYAVSDACGNTITVQQLIIVDDDTNPVISNCPADILVSADPVTCDAVVSWTEPTASDNCTLAGFTRSHIPGTNFSVGTTVVSYTATDACGNTATCVFNITVVDQEDPVITTCAADRILPVDNNCQALTPDLTGEVTATDVCSPVVTISQSPAPGTPLPFGTTTVTLTATDGSGNSAECYADVTVIDDSPPVLFTIDTTAYIAAGNQAIIDSSFVWDDIASSDNCGITLVTIDINTFDCSMLGPHTVNVTAYDAAGNSTSGTATVTVSDTNTVTTDAGPDAMVLEGTSYTLSGASVDNGTVIWGTTGDGTFDDPTSVNPVYTLAATDTDSVKLYMDVTPITGCVPVSDTMKLTISKGALADAGADDYVCITESTYDITDAWSSGGDVLWTTGGDGSFDDPTIDNPIYTFGANDLLNGSVSLTMTVTSTGIGGQVSDDKVITINDLPGIVVDEHSDITCHGLTDGILRISGSGNGSPYQYSINGSAYQASGEFTGLAAGDYLISVVDAFGCEKDTTITIIEPAVFAYTLDKVSNNSCYESDDASISISISGGTQPYAISWTGPDGFTSTDEDLLDLAAGLYSLNLTDANNCNVFTLDVNITEPPGIIVTPLAQSDYNGYGVRCYGATDGFIDVDLSGGTGSLAASWEGPGGFTSTDEDISGLAAGDYTLTVTDDTGCTLVYEVSLSEPDELYISYLVTDGSCPDVPDGAIDITIGGGVAPYTVLWDDGVTVEDRADVYPGDYLLEVADANGCTLTESISVGFEGVNCLEVPEVITPGVVDGRNDVLIIRNIDLHPDAEIKIFNRWGRLIFSAKNLEENRWDGTYQGKALPVDSYHYILDLHDGSTPRTGTITIIR